VTFFSRNLEIFKRIGLPLYVLTLAYTSLDQLLTINIDESLRSPTGAMGAIWGLGFVSLVLGIVFPILGILVVLYGAKEVGSKDADPASEKGLFEFILKFFSQVSIEILRSWGKTLLWSLLFLVPGIWKYIQYTFIPFIVTLSRSYDLGEKDALRFSAAIVRHHMLKVVAILVIFHFLVPSVMTVLFDDYRLVWNTPVPALLLTFVDVYLFIVSTQLLLMVFEKDNEVDAKKAETMNAPAYL
jgi:hypothetical protein